MSSDAPSPNPSPWKRRLKLWLRKLRTLWRHGTNDPERVFTNFYTKNLWQNPESRSGSGSTLAYTAPLRRELPGLLTRRGVGTLLDAPCGDFHWFQHLERPAGLRYLGGDIVAPLVEENQRRFGDDRTRFLRLDITRDPLPPAELWMCRDCLFHLSNAQIAQAVQNFLRSDIAYLLTSLHPQATENIDIPTGYFRPLNLCLPPFAWPEPLETLEDFVPGFLPRQMALWSRAQLQDWARQQRSFRFEFGPPDKTGRQES